MTRYAFINADSIVVQVISGALNVEQQEQFLRDYSVIFGAVQIIEVEDDTRIWIGGRYDSDAGFLPPAPQPQPEPLPEPEPGAEPIL